MCLQGNTILMSFSFLKRDCFAALAMTRKGTVFVDARTSHCERNEAISNNRLHCKRIIPKFFNLFFLNSIFYIFDVFHFGGFCPASSAHHIEFV